LHAQSASAAPEAPTYARIPIPAKILQAKTVFISNALYAEKDEMLSYQSFYRRLEATNRYVLVDDPAKADLVMEMRYALPHETETGETEIRLAIYDRPTHYLLWSINLSIKMANRRITHLKNVDQAAADLVQKLTSLGKQEYTAPKP